MERAQTLMAYETQMPALLAEPERVRSGDIGSPRSSGSTSASSAGLSPESSSAAFFRPQQGWRTHPNGAWQEPSSAAHARPWPPGPSAVAATILMPPCPSGSASAPMASRR